MTAEQEVRKLKTELDRIKEKLSRIENVKQLQSNATVEQIVYSINQITKNIKKR